MAEIEEQFRAALARAGIEHKGALRADGELHRFHVEGDKPGSKNGWYVLHADGVASGAFGSWKTGAHETWRADIGRRLSDAEDRELRARMETMKRQRARELAARQAECRAVSARLWKAASKPRKDHPYLTTKGVRAHGLRQLRSDLLVPVRDAAGALHGLQFIRADGSKQFKAGTDKVGRYHGIGPKVGDLVAIAEGYATAASVHEATGWPVAVAFDKGNLRPVAEAMRARFPAARTVLCADNDAASEGNPGLTAASEAAEAVGGIVALPELVAGAGATDWNDYAAAHGTKATGEKLGAALVMVATPRAAALAAEAIPEAPAKMMNGAAHEQFTCDAEGIWWHWVNEDDEPKKRRIGPPLQVAAKVRRATDSTAWGALLVFRDPGGIEHRWCMPARMLSGSCEEMRGELLHLGYTVSTNPKTRNLVTDYIQHAALHAQTLARCVERTGWHDGVFVLPERTLGGCEEPVLFQTETAATHVYRARGDLADWRSDVAELCRGNSRLLFAVSGAFAAMLVHWAGEESGGFHLRGGSSTGKTTALRVAASVYGGPDYLHRWRATDNALEAIAAGHSDTLLILDELAQIDPRIAGEAAYMLANGEGKARAHRSGGSRPVLSWRLLFLSAGEVRLSDHMQQAGKRAHAGQETRLADVPADAGAGLGLFENLHGYKDGASFARALIEAAASCYGLAAPAFVELVQRNADALPTRLRREREEFLRRHVPAGADGQVKRVAARFALVASAGELASEAKVTGWEAGEAAEGVLACFRAWLSQRGGAGNLEPQRMLEQVRHFLELHAKSRFERWSTDTESGNYIIQNRAGFRRGELSEAGDSEEHFYILKECFRAEVCSGLDHQAVAHALAEAGCLKREGRNYTRSERLPGMGKTRCYVVTPAIFKTGDDAMQE